MSDVPREAKQHLANHCKTFDQFSPARHVGRTSIEKLVISQSQTVATRLPSALLASGGGTPVTRSRHA